MLSLFERHLCIEYNLKVCTVCRPGYRLVVYLLCLSYSAYKGLLWYEDAKKVLTVKDGWKEYN